MPDSQAIKRLFGWVVNAERILLIAHERADGDAVASALSFAHGLKQLGKEVDCVSRDVIPPAFQFLPGADQFQTDFFIGDYDLIITFDCGDARRTGFPERLRHFAKTRKRLANIDQHPKNDLHRMANLNIIDYSVAATAQIVYRIFKQYQWSITHEIATCLLCGIHTDTGGFKHPNTSPLVLETAAQLLAYGGRLKDIQRHLANAHSVAMLRLWGAVLDRLQYHEDFGIVSSVVTLNDLVICGADQQDVSGVINLMKNVVTSRLAILFIEQPDGSVRASLRTDAEGVDVSKLAVLFGGRGLKRAGGFTIPGHLQQTMTGWDIVRQ